MITVLKCLLEPEALILTVCLSPPAQAGLVFRMNEGNNSSFTSLLLLGLTAYIFGKPGEVPTVKAATPHRERSKKKVGSRLQTGDPRSLTRYTNPLVSLVLNMYCLERVIVPAFGQEGARRRA